ncbi:MAG: DUF1552 domain-containing protein [Myxococcota bacterium]
MTLISSSRRSFLRGAGVTLALPLLESLMPARAFAQATSTAPRRLLYWFIPNGVMYRNWIPAKTGPLDPMALPASLVPLRTAGVAGDVTILSGIDNLAGAPDNVGDHASGIAAMLTCVPAKKAALSDLGLGPSVDQVAAGQLGKLTARPSIELGMARSGSTGNCDNGYACPYAQSMSWTDATTPRPKRTDPHDAWLYLLGGNTNLPAADRERMRAGDKSVLDYLLNQSSKLSSQIGAEDRVKLDQYLTSVRAIEQQLTTTNGPTAPACQAGEGPANSTDYVKRFSAMLDVMEFAFKCDLTRVATFMFGNAFGPGPMPWIGVSEDYHALTHRMGAAGVPDQVAKCILWEVEQIAAFAKRLKAIPEGSQTVLYNTAFMVTSDVGEGAPHNHDNVPVLIAGNSGGAFTPGKHLAFTPEDPNARRLAGTRDGANRTRALAIPNTNRMANVHLTMLQAAGVQVTKFADSNGTIKNL